MRARWRIGWNTFLRGARWRRMIFGLVAAALAFLSLTAMLASYGLTRFVGNITEDAQRADVIVNSTLSGSLVLSFMVSFTVALAALYLSKDLDLLLAAPLPRRAIFFAKLVAGLAPAHVVILVITFVPLVGHGLAQGYGARYYAALAVALLLLPVLPVALGAASVALIVRSVSAQRVGEVVGALVMLMTLSVALVLGSARQLQEAVSLRDMLGLLDRFRSPWSPAEWLTLGVTRIARGDDAAGLAWLGLVAGLGLLACLPLYFVSDEVYQAGWLKMQSAARRSELKQGFWPWSRVDRATDLGRPSGLFRWLSPPTVAVLRKDMRVFPRDLTNIAQVLSPLAIGIFFVLQQLLYPIRFGSEALAQVYVRPILAMLSAGIASGVAAMILTRFGLTAFSFEGRSYWVLKGAPIARRELVLGKFLVAYIPYLILGGGLVLLLELARALSDARLFDAPLTVALAQTFDPPLLAYAFFVVALVGAGTVAITLAIGAARPNMRWDTPHEMLTPDVGCLSLVLYGGYGAVTGLALGLPMAVSRFAMLPGRPFLWAAGLGLGLVVTAVAVSGGLWLTAGELDAIGE
ncbi:MAG: hypothetical protein KDH92_10895 [Chloroflexi bacterium]|nr:hypothetical protein [Chloroflexota bacterium]